MSRLRNYWMSLLALALLLAAGVLFFAGYLPAKELHETEKATIATQTAALREQLTEDLQYAALQAELEPAAKAIEASRRELYANFPVEMKEEDQILYMLHLEEKLGGEVMFRFAQAEDIVTLSDGAVLQGMTFTFDYKTTYEGFQDMVRAIATDARIASVRYATLDYDAGEDVLAGQMTIMVYLLQDGRAYGPPVVTVPPVGKENPYQK